MIASDGRLSMYWPVADDDGIDLLVYDKLSGRALPTQVKSRTVTLMRRSGKRGNVVHFEIRKATFRADRFVCVVLVLLSPDASTIERAWVMPMQDLPKYAASRSTKYVIRPSRSLTSRDKCSRYRCDDWRTLTQRVQTVIDGLAPRPHKIRFGT